MKISTLYNKPNQSRTIFAIEAFPPKKDAPVERIYAALGEIAALKPDYISVTCGAGGSDAGGNAPTIAVSSLIKNTYGIETMAHLTCVSSSKAQVLTTLEALREHNIENVLALRGDINPDIVRKKDFQYASNLTAFINEFSDIETAGACYPEGHSEAQSINADLHNLKRKIDAGCKTLITQVFFDNALFYSFLDKARLIGIDVPIAAGIIAVTSKSQIERMVSMCGASLPAKFVKMIAKYESRPEALRDAGIAYATEQIVDLISSGVDGIHFYAMNSPYVARKIHENIKALL
ncbi:MAG: methylenetetrahydrofolate reductase [NAD(P)H] [Oscillospiraceae bacterium]|nr:methylenetetrahydrofolate reductase [NAD(P)H] [Oscillospiraceae bacterium]